MTDAQNRGEPQRSTSLTLLQRLRNDEPDAWRTLVHLYTPLVYQWCSRSGLQGADADDVLQEVFKSVATHIGRFRRERQGDTFRGWLRAITKNMIALHFRRGGRQPQGSGGTDAIALLHEVPAPDRELSDEVQAAFETDCLCRRALDLVRGDFEERTWRMFWLTFIEERSPTNVAADLGVTSAAVRKAKSRVLHRLKSEFAELIQ